MLGRMTSKPLFVQLGYTLSLCEGWREGERKRRKEKKRKRRLEIPSTNTDSSMFLHTHTEKKRRTRPWPIVDHRIASSIYATPRLAGL